METPLVLSREQVRQVDRLAIERYGASGLVLMENAGRGVADVLMEADPSLGAPRAQGGGADASAGASPDGEGFVGVLCGKGNNGGDGFVLARHLDILGVPVRVGFLCAPDEIRGDAEANFRMLQLSDVELFDLWTWPLEAGGAKPLAARGRDDAIPLLAPPFEGGGRSARDNDWTASTLLNLEERMERHLGGAAWIVDALLGTGAMGEPREPVATAIRWMNAQPGLRLAVDVPSGLDCDTGMAAGATVQADVTCTMVANKQGFFEEAAKEYLGEVRVVSIGLPPQLVQRVLGTYIGSS